MEFEKAVRLLEKYDAEVPVLASTERLGEPRRFLLRTTYVEAGYTTMHLHTYPTTLHCPPSPFLTPAETHLFNHPATAHATTPIADLHRTIWVLSGPSGRKYYLCHETRMDPDIRYLLQNNTRPLQLLRNAAMTCVFLLQLCWVWAC